MDRDSTHQKRGKTEQSLDMPQLPSGASPKRGLGRGRSIGVTLILLVIVCVIAGASISILAGETPTEIFYALAGLIAALLFLLLISMLIFSSARKVTGPIPFGRRIVAIVVSIDHMPIAWPDTDPSQCVCVVTALWADPKTQTTYTFWQKFDHCPNCVQGDLVSIILDPRDPQRYYIEL